MNEYLFHEGCDTCMIEQAEIMAEDEQEQVPNFGTWGFVWLFGGE